MNLRSSCCCLLCLAAVLRFLAGCLSPSPEEEIQVIAGSGANWDLPQAEGEQELNALAHTARTEDAWLYLMGTWTDIGVQEAKKSVMIDLKELQLIAGRHAAPSMAAMQPVFFHLHLFSTDPRSVDPPSLEDLHALAVLKEQLAWVGGRSVTGVMLDGRGRWTFDLPPELARRLLRDCVAGPAGAPQNDYAESHGYMARSDLAGRFDLEYSQAVLEAMGGMEATTRTDRIRTFIAEAGHLGVAVTYRDD